MRLPHEDDLRRERSRFMDTIETLTDDEFAHGTTLCEGWTPRDVLAHLIGIDDAAGYANPRALTINRGNARAVEAAAGLSREELTARGWAAAQDPPAVSRACSWLFAGDVAVHHLDLSLSGLAHE